MKLRLLVLSVAAVFLVIKNSVAESQYGFLHALHESMAQMHAAMDRVSSTGDPDRDFALMMIPHHQGAIDMAKVELLYGKDPVMRRLAQEIIADQQSEIDAMRLQLSKSSGKAKKEN